MKVFGNHFRVDEDASKRLRTYDSRVASVFEIPSLDLRDVSVHYVRVLKDILKLDYGPLSNYEPRICHSGLGFFFRFWLIFIINYSSKVVKVYLYCVSGIPYNCEVPCLRNVESL